MKAAMKQLAPVSGLQSIRCFGGRFCFRLLQATFSTSGNFFLYNCFPASTFKCHTSTRFKATSFYYLMLSLGRLVLLWKQFNVFNQFIFSLTFQKFKLK